MEDLEGGNGTQNGAGGGTGMEVAVAASEDTYGVPRDKDPHRHMIV